MKIAIVIPVLNQMEFMNQCLSSICKTAPDKHSVDVITVDSASTEPIEQMQANYASANPHINFLYTRLEKNKGVTIPWNIGLDIAMNRGADVVCISNSDVVYGRAVIERCAEVASEKGACFPLTNQRGPLPQDFYIRTRELAEKPMAPECLVDTRGFAGWCFFLSRETIEKVGRFDEQFTLWFQDTDYHNRLRTAGITPWEVRACLLHHYESRTILSMPQQFECFGWRKEDERRFAAKYKQG